MYIAMYTTIVCMLHIFEEPLLPLPLIEQIYDWILEN